MKEAVSIAAPGGIVRNKTEYPLWSMLAVMGLLYLAPLVSMWLSVPAFAVCVYRIVRYDARVFAVDYAILTPVVSLMQLPSGLSLVVFLSLLGALWYFIREGVRGDAAFMVIILLLCYLLTRMEMQISNFVLCFGQLFALFVLLPKQDAWSAETAMKAFCISVIISSVYALVLRDTSYIYTLRGAEVPAYWGSSVRRFQGLFKDCNYYMTLVIAALAALVKLRYCGQIGVRTFVFAGVCMTILGILTYSKTFILVYLLLAAVSILWLYGEKAPAKAVMLGLAGVLAVGVALFAEFSPLMVIVTRLTSGSGVGDFTTGRSELFARYFAEITSNIGTLLFGCGFGADILAKAPHNLYLEIAYYSGFTGLILFLAYGILLGRRMLLKLYNRQDRNLVATWLSLGCVVILHCALHGMFSVVMYGVFFQAYLSILLEKRREDK